MPKRFPSRRPHSRRPRSNPIRKITKRGVRKFVRRYPRVARAVSRGLSAIRVKTDGITTTFNSDVNAITPFMRSMGKRYLSGAKNVFKNMLTAQIYVPINQQNYYSFSSYNVLDLKAALSSVSQQPGSLGSNYNTARSFWGTYRSDITMTNSSNGNQQIAMYVFDVKADTSQSVTNLFQNGMKDETGQTSIDYSLYFGSNPLDSQAVSQFYKCRKIVNIILNPGQSHIQRITHHKNMPLNNELIDNANQSDVYLKGWTRVWFFLVRGLPATSTTTSGQIGTNITTLDIIQTESYDFKYITDNRTNYTYNLASVLATATNVYNQGSGGTSISAGI